jgi:hypothetical protein
MSEEMMCLECRRYMTGDSRCRCLYPKPSEDGRTRISIDQCGVCGVERPNRVPGPAPIPRQYFCVKHIDFRPRSIECS